MIPVREELDIVKSYMTIINIRYENEISIRYQVDEKADGYIDVEADPAAIGRECSSSWPASERGKGRTSDYYEDGGQQNDGSSIKDNGVGISEEKVRLILEGEYKNSKSGFGIYSVKQRVELFYGVEDAVSISSQPGRGTEVSVRFPYKEEYYNVNG